MVYHCFQLQTFGSHPGSGSSVNLQFCPVYAPPVPPSNIANVSVSDPAVQRSDSGLVTFGIEWLEPENLNGNATIGPTYQLWIGTDYLPPKASISDFLSQRLIFVSEIRVSDGT